MPEMRQNIYTISFALILGLVCALLLTATAEFTRPRQMVNKRAEEIRNILTALKIPFDRNASPEELIAIFKRDIAEQTLGREDPLTVYVYRPGGSRTAAVAVRFKGAGLWGPIEGFLALEPDYRTVRGVTFYEQEETPGLGGDIVTETFRSRFEGKQIISQTGQSGIDIVAGGTEPTGQNEVAGISGATMTCDKVEAMINTIIKALADKRNNDGR